MTGDLGTIEADGRIPFRGRLKEMNKTGGVNVAPLEVEQIKFKLLHLGGHGARQLQPYLQSIFASEGNSNVLAKNIYAD